MTETFIRASLCIVAALVAPAASSATPPRGHTDASIEGPSWKADKGVWRYRVTSALQKGPNDVEVLLPDDYESTHHYRVLYVLPVETGIGGRYGDGLEVVRSTGVHNQHQLICVAPAFDTVPWFMDHATDPQRRHESYLMTVVVPLVESRYSVAPPPSGRLLLGFSKSGWGAYTLLLRHPDFFGSAAAWDAPFMLEEADWQNWGIADAAGTQENFRAYQPLRLLKSRAGEFGGSPRFVLLGHKSFGPNGGTRYRGDHTHTLGTHRLMTSQGIRHVYDNDIRVPHRWLRAWVEPAVRHLVTISAVGEKTKIVDQPSKTDADQKGEQQPR